MRSLSPPTFQLRNIQPNPSLNEDSSKGIFANKIGSLHSSENERPPVNFKTNAPYQLMRQDNKTGLPDGLKSGVENLSGYSLDDVNVHYNSSKPAQLQAHAFTQSNNIHVAPGQEQHLSHEAWHVVQQKQGRVQPTMQLKNKFVINNDEGLEREADTMGLKAENHVSSKANKTQFKKNRSSVRGTNNAPIQRKLLMPVGGTLKRFSNDTHGQSQVARIVQQNQFGGDWEKFLFDSEDYVWNAQNQEWIKAGAQLQGQNTPDADAESLQSTEMLMEAGGFAAGGALAGGHVGWHMGSVVGESMGSYIGLPGLGSAVGGIMGTMGGSAVGGLTGGLMNLDVPRFAEAKIREKLWQLGIVPRGVEIDLGLSDITKFLGGYEISLNPKIAGVKKHLNIDGNDISLENFNTTINLTWKKMNEVEFKMPSLNAALEVNLADPNTQARFLEVKGNLGIKNLEIDASLDGGLKAVLGALLKGIFQIDGVLDETSKDAMMGLAAGGMAGKQAGSFIGGRLGDNVGLSELGSTIGSGLGTVGGGLTGGAAGGLYGMIKSMKANKAAVKEKILEIVYNTLEASINCEKITAGLNIQTFASPGQQGRAADLGDDNFSATVDVDQLGLDVAPQKSLTSGRLGNLSAKVSRDKDGGAHPASATVNATGAFQDLPALKEVVDQNKSKIKGLRGGKIVDALASKGLSYGLGKAADGPNVAIMLEVYKKIKANPGGISLTDIHQQLVSEKILQRPVTVQEVVSVCKKLMKKGKITGQNTSRTKRRLKGLIGRDTERSFAPNADYTPPIKKVAKIGKKTGQGLTKGASSMIKEQGLDINIRGKAGAGPGNTTASINADAHVDKELVAKGYKLLELVGTVVKAVE